LTNITLSDNVATNDGGGILNFGTTILTNVTLSGNSANAGGGIENLGMATLTNVTLSNNSAGFGAGIETSGSATMILKNTVIANSTRGDNCYAFFFSDAYLNSNGFNLSDDNSCAAYFNKTGDQNNLNVHLSGLANFSGSTLTHMPLRGSPTIDKGQCRAGADQRGKPRPVGSACDIGAVERQPEDWDGYIYLPLALKK